MSTEPVLPELPQEVDAVWVMVRGEKDLAEAQDYYFTADQMRAYGLACLKAGRERAFDEAADMLCDALQGDLENGVKCLNERASADFRQRYPDLWTTIAAIRSMAEGSAG